MADEHGRFASGCCVCRVVSGLHRIRSDTNASGDHRANGSSYEHERSSCHANGTGDRCADTNGSGDNSANAGTCEHSSPSGHSNGAAHCCANAGTGAYANSCSNCYTYGSNRGRPLSGNEH